MLRLREKMLAQQQAQLCRRVDMAHSPLHRAIFDMEEKRSNLFLDRRRIPGRKAKLLFIGGFFVQLFGIQQLKDIKQLFRQRDEDLRKIQRKSAPFLQAMTDLRNCAMEDRKNMIVEELFADRPPEYLAQLRNRFFQKDIWVPPINVYGHQHNGTNKNIKPYTHLQALRFVHGVDKFNI